MQQWNENWRFDIQEKISLNRILFEVSKVSFGKAESIGIDTCNWHETFKYKHSSISCSGFMDLKNNKVIFKSAILHSQWIRAWHGAVDSVAYPPAIIFDSSRN